MGQPWRGRVLWGWVSLIVGIMACGANSLGLTVIGGSRNPGEREHRARRALETLEGIPLLAVGAGRKSAVSALQEYFGRGVLSGMLVFLVGLGLVSGKEWGRKLCMGSLLLLLAWTVIHRVGLGAYGVPVSQNIVADISVVALIVLLWWKLTRPSGRGSFSSGRNR